MRAALGASRGRIARALLSESVVLALAGGVVGVALAQAATGLLRTIAPAELPRVDDIGIDPTVLLFTLSISVLSGVAVRPVCRPAIREPEHHGAQGGRPIGKRRSRATPHPQCAGRRTSRTGADAADRLGADDSDVRRDATGRSGFHAPGGGPDVRHRDPARPHQRSTTGGAHARERRGTTGSGAGRHLRWSLVFHHDGRRGQRQHDRGRGVPRSRRARWTPLRRFKSFAPGYFETMGNRLVAGRSITWSEIYERAAGHRHFRAARARVLERARESDRQACPRCSSARAMARDRRRGRRRARRWAESAADGDCVLADAE